MNNGKCLRSDRSELSQIVSIPDNGYDIEVEVEATEEGFASVFTRRIASVTAAEGEQKTRQRTMANFGEFVLTSVLTH